MMRHNGWLGGALGLALLLSSGVRAAPPPTYTVQPLVKIGETVGDTGVRAQYEMVVSALTDSGQLLFMVANDNNNALLQYADGKYTVLMRPGQPAPLGKWPSGWNWAWSLFNSNQSGSTVWVHLSDGRAPGTYLWDAKTGQMSFLTQAGKPATEGLTFANGEAQPTINNLGQIALPAWVRKTGSPDRLALFLREPDGKLQLVALPGQAGADGVPIYIHWGRPLITSINDTGRVAFIARRHGQARPGAYIWESGALRPAVLPGTLAPGGGTIVDVVGAWLNNRNQNLLVEAALDHIETGPRALYLWDGTQLRQVATPGQAMPGGGQFATLSFEQPHHHASVSFANELGQHAFYARVSEGGRTQFAAYLMDADGTLSLIVKPGSETALGRIAQVDNLNGWGIALNRQGQVALTVRPEGGPATLALFTPVPAEPDTAGPVIR